MESDSAPGSLDWQPRGSLTTAMAFVAIKRQLYDQHKEWMIRSYVVTTGFVTFRIMFPLLQGSGIGSATEQLAVAAWGCWAIPLLFTEAILQGRKILAVKPGSLRPTAPAAHRASRAKNAGH